MKSILRGSLLCTCAIAALTLLGCGGEPTGPPTAHQPTTSNSTTPGGGKEAARPTSLARVSVPDFTDMFSNIAPGVVISVKAWRIDARTWWVEIEVLQCNDDLCRTIWYEYIYTTPPTDPEFTIALRDALDQDGDGVWNWQEKFGIDYQQ